MQQFEVKVRREDHSETMVVRVAALSHVEALQRIAAVMGPVMEVPR